MNIKAQNTMLKPVEESFVWEIIRLSICFKLSELVKSVRVKSELQSSE